MKKSEFRKRVMKEHCSAGSSFERRTDRLTEFAEEAIRDALAEVSPASKPWDPEEPELPERIDDPGDLRDAPMAHILTDAAACYNALHDCIRHLKRSPWEGDKVTLAVLRLTLHEERERLR